MKRLDTRVKIDTVKRKGEDIEEEERKERENELNTNEGYAFCTIYLPIYYLLLTNCSLTCLSLVIIAT